MKRREFEELTFLSGRLYFVSERYFHKFSSSNRSLSHTVKNLNYPNSSYRDELSGRPHICVDVSKSSLPEKKIIWLVPISSKVSKYEQEILRHKVKYGTCDKILIVNVNGEKRAALVQNLIPCSVMYLTGIYCNRNNGEPVSLDRADLSKVMLSVKKLALLHKSYPTHGFLFNDVVEILRTLVEENKAMHREKIMIGAER